MFILMIRAIAMLLQIGHGITEYRWIYLAHNYTVFGLVKANLRVTVFVKFGINNFISFF